MSGNSSGGGGGSGVGAGGGSGGSAEMPVAPCEKVKFEAQLASPQKLVVDNLGVGEVLGVAVVDMKGTRVVQVQKDGVAAGGLAGPDATRLRNCVDEGHNYIATVISVNVGQVRVQVTHAE